MDGSLLIIFPLNVSFLVPEGLPQAAGLWMGVEVLNYDVFSFYGYWFSTLLSVPVSDETLADRG